MFSTYFFLFTVVIVDEKEVDISKVPPQKHVESSSLSFLMVYWNMWH